MLDLYKCQRCGVSLDIDDGLLCVVCFAIEHARKADKQQPTHDDLIQWLNDPGVANFFDAVRKEVIFQRSSWRQLDAMKNAGHWFWLVASLATKALQATDHTKRKHHIITASACLYQWLAREIGGE